MDDVIGVMAIWDMDNEARRVALSPSFYPYGVGGGYAMSDNGREACLMSIDRAAIGRNETQYETV